MRAHSLRQGVAGLAAGLAAALAADAQAPQFARHIDDLPMLAGLAETVGGHAFETADGRLARVVAEGGATAEVVAAAYAEALAALGWRLAFQTEPRGAETAGAIALEYHRAGEALAITIVDMGGGRTRTAFDLRPLEAGARPAGEGEFDDGL